MLYRIYQTTADSDYVIPAINEKGNSETIIGTIYLEVVRLTPDHAMPPHGSRALAKISIECAELKQRIRAAVKALQCIKPNGWRIDIEDQDI